LHRHKNSVPIPEGINGRELFVSLPGSSFSMLLEFLLLLLLEMNSVAS
jgi:hypothetical protein